MFICVFLWKFDDSFQKAIIDDLGQSKEFNLENYERLLVKRIEELGEIEITTINIAPFKIERYGISFGFIYQGDDDEWEEKTYPGWIELHPGNNMAFPAQYEDRDEI